MAKPKRNPLTGRLPVTALEGKRIARFAYTHYNGRLHYCALDRKGTVLFTFGPYDLFDEAGNLYDTSIIEEKLP